MTIKPRPNEFPAIHGSQPWNFLGWLLCLVGLPSMLAAQQPVSKVPGPLSESAVNTDAFTLADIANARWYSNRDFLGRPLVVVHVASWSSSAHRLLPLWQKQLQPTVSSQQVQVVAIAHETHVARAAWMCEEAGWTWPILYEPLLEAVQANGRVDFPWASVFDAQGALVHPRLTLAELVTYLASIEPKQPSQTQADVKQTDLDAPPATSDPAQLLAQLHALRRDSATLETLQPIADQLLRAAFQASAEQAQEYLPPVIGFYQEALNSTEDGQWAFRLSVAYRLAFDLSHTSSQVDATLWQKSLDYLELANQSATVLPAWRELWAQHHRREEQAAALDSWLVERCRNSPMLGIDSLLVQRQLGSPLFEAGSSTAADWTQAPNNGPLQWPRATPVPPASIQFQTVWVDSGQRGGSTDVWSRLYLHVRLKRGQWSLQSMPRLQWQPFDAGHPDDLRMLEPLVQIGLPTEESATNEDNAEVNSVWLQIDVRWPEEFDPTTRNQKSHPPRRNAKLAFQGRDPLTGQFGWREAEFYLAQPESSRLDR